MKASVPTLVVAAALVLTGASECGVKSKNESCNITARDTENITMECTDESGNKRTVTERHPSDLYPKCQVGTYWPGCKQA
jgi:hypothetical protein